MKPPDNINELDDAVFAKFTPRGSNLAICVLCLINPGGFIHEKVPRSARPLDWWLHGNRVTICPTCHTLIHTVGAQNFEEVLQDNEEFLFEAGILGRVDKGPESNRYSPNQTFNGMVDGQPSELNEDEENN